MPRKILDAKTKIKINLLIIFFGGLISFSSANAATQIYRSVGPENTSPLAEGTANNLTISSSEAVFSVALSNNIGVGDVIQYDSDDDDTVDALAFIYSRTNSTHYTVKNISGEAPLAVSTDTHWSIFRSYTSLGEAEAGTENSGIDSELQDFDTWTDGKNLVSADEQWNIACYADSADITLGVFILDWTTDADNFLKIYTPYLESEVGESQRHLGVWNESAYQLIINPEDFPNGSTISINSASDSSSVNVWIDGLQISATNQSISSGGIDVYNIDGSTKISNSLIKSDPLTTSTYGILINSLANHGTYHIWNNIIYGFTQGGISMHDSINTLHAYNNTIVGDNNSETDDYCMENVAGFENTFADFIAKNNIAQGCSAGFSGSFDASSGYNLSDFEDATGLHSKNLITLTFSDSADEDYHLDSSDEEANAGMNLSSDNYLLFSNDIDGDNREDLWYIGADEKTPETEQTCTDFTYSDWGDCQSNNTRTREISASFPASCTDGNPEALSQECEYIPPTCTYTYSDWGACQSNSTQTRSLLTSLPANCSGTPNLSQACSYVAPASNSSSHKKKKKKKSKKNSIKTISKKASPGQVISLTGKKFSKNSLVRVFYPFGGSTLIRTNAQGGFSIPYRIFTNKPAGNYSWFAIDLIKNKRSKNTTFQIK